MGGQTAQGALRFTQAGWLAPADGVLHVPTTRTVALEGPEPLAVVWHWTASRGKSAEHVKHLADEVASGHGASWHFAIGRTGLVVQSTGVLTGTNHVGRMGSVLGQQVSVNRNTVGIELENAGRVVRVQGGWRQVENPQAVVAAWRPTALVVPPAEVDDDTICHRFTDEQVGAAVALVRALAEFFDWDRDRFWYGHSDFDPVRKADPGPLWRRTILPRVLTEAGL